jgi:signal transduction histidine kinase
VNCGAVPRYPQIAAFDRGEAGEPFTEAEEQLLLTFAAHAANGVAIVSSVAADRLRAAVAAADAERGRWARELHDDTLQVLGGLRVLLADVLRRGESGRYEAAIRQAVEDLGAGTESLRAIISDLRPSALDDLGLQPALEALLERRRHDGLQIAAELELPDPQTRSGVLHPELETAVYRIVQEALTNVVKHASASTVRVAVRATETRVTIEVRDDGIGFDAGENTDGFGLAGMRERVYLLGGRIEVDSSERGTSLLAALPTPHADDANVVITRGLT